MQFTLIIEKSEDGWYVGQVEEVPAAISQGRTIEELRANILDAVNLLFQTNREETEKLHLGRTVIRERLKVA